jgi:hypothetical protein
MASFRWKIARDKRVNRLNSTHPAYHQSRGVWQSKMERNAEGKQARQRKLLVSFETQRFARPHIAGRWRNVGVDLFESVLGTV